LARIQDAQTPVGVIPTNPAARGIPDGAVTPVAEAKKE